MVDQVLAAATLFRLRSFLDLENDRVTSGSSGSEMQECAPGKHRVSLLKSTIMGAYPGDIRISPT
jgi:hypothetical protein